MIDRRLWDFMGESRTALAGCVAIGVCASVVGIVRLALLGWLIGLIFKGAGLEQLVIPALGVALVMLLRGGLEHWRTMVAHRTAAEVQLSLRKQIHQKILDLGPAHFGTARTGEVILAVVEGVEQLEVWFGQYLPQIAVATLTPFVVFALLAPFDWVVAGILLGFALVTLVAPAGFHRLDVKNSRRRAKAYAAFAADFLDALQGLATLKAFGQSKKRGEVLAERAHEVFRSTMWVLATNSLTRGITDTGLAVGAAVALGVGAYRVQAGEMALEVLLMVVMAGIEVFRPQRDLRSLLHNGMMGLSAAQGIFAVLDAEPLVKANRHAARANDAIQPSIEFENVTFAYPEAHQPSHQMLNLKVAPGERVGVVGPSGAGKSTLLKLLLRTYDPSEGTVKLGGKDIRELHVDDLYGAIATVSQDAFAFHGTVEDNIRFGNPDAPMHAVEQAARDANALEFIEKLPNGFDTVIGERGIRLSGGQRQRLAIARALLRDAPVLVLDEALSAVDARNEAAIQQALDRLMEGRTTLIFAHRLSSVLNTDRIVVLNEGQVVEEGTHATLIRDGQHYRALMAGQVTRANPELSAPSVDVASTASSDQASSESDAVPAESKDDLISASGLSWMQAISVLMHSAMPWLAKLIATFVFGVTRVAALIGVGVLSAMVISSLKQGEPFETWLFWLAIAAPVAGIVHWLESWVAHDMAFRMLAEMRVALYQKLDELAPAFLIRRRTGDLVAMATHDVEMVEYFFAHTIAPAFVAVLVPTTVIVVVGSQGWPLALALVPFLALVALSPFAARKRIDALGSADRVALADLNAFLVDTVQGLGDVIAFQQSERRKGAFMERAKHHVQTRLPFYRDLSLQSALLEAATGLGALAVVTAGAYWISTGAMPSHVMPVLTVLALAAFLPISEIAHIGRQLADTLGATRRLNFVHTSEPAVRAPAIPKPLDPSTSLALVFEQVDFAYPGRQENALTDVCFELKAGQSMALVGPSGAGKSTVAQLSLRFWDPAAGGIKLMGTDLRSLDPEELRRQIALVSQETWLFNDTLKANILMANPEADETSLNEAIERASLTEFVRGLPDGLETRVGERGVRLSGGQRQRIAIARAFLKDAAVLILDEATSHLDAVNESAVHAALESLMDSRSTIIIAHRLSTIKNADEILVLDEGAVVERGHHDDLIACDGLYRRLVSSQLALSAEREGAKK